MTNGRFLHILIKLCDRGLKFIPSLFLNENDLFKFILLNFDNNFNAFNSKLKLSKERFLKEISRDNQSNDVQCENRQEMNFESLNSSFLNRFYEKIKSSNKTFNKLHFNLSHESIDFKYNFYKNLSDIFISKNFNLSSEELMCLKLYTLERPFKVIDCDKNVGLCILKDDTYNGFVFDQLNNCINYEYISFDPLISTVIKINNVLHTLFTSKYLHESIYKKLIPAKNSKLGSFRLLAKL